MKKVKQLSQKFQDVKIYINFRNKKNQIILKYFVKIIKFTLKKVLNNGKQNSLSKISFNPK